MKHVNLTKSPCKASLYQTYSTILESFIFCTDIETKEYNHISSKLTSIDSKKNENLATLPFPSLICRVEHFTSLTENSSQNQCQHCINIIYRSGPNLELLYVRQSDTAKNSENCAKLYFDA